tara:strand:- start:131 stop:706 length:576 start_codon:yes stop_codon:yes gene_type:complete
MLRASDVGLRERMHYNKDYIDQVSEKADSLFLEEHGGVSGEFHPQFPNIKMFNTKTGEYTDEFRKIQEDTQGGVMEYKMGMGDKKVRVSPREYYYWRLNSSMEDTVDMAFPAGWSFDIGDNASNPLKKRVMKAYGDKPLYDNDGNFVGPNKLYNNLSRVLLNSNNPRSINKDMTVENIKNRVINKNLSSKK